MKNIQRNEARLVGLGLGPTPSNATRGRGGMVKPYVAVVPMEVKVVVEENYFVV